jgi:type III restriction enzyme
VTCTIPGRDSAGSDNPLQLIVEVTGRGDKNKQARVSTATDLWVPAVNNAGQWGRWAFIEVNDPWDAANAIRYALVPQPAEDGN